jgi:hypothetical protein
MTNEVIVRATYDSKSSVPRIGQRKRMRVNGKVELLTLNKIEAERRHCYRDDSTETYEYDTTETWASYTNVPGW